MSRRIRSADLAAAVLVLLAVTSAVQLLRQMIGDRELLTWLAAGTVAVPSLLVLTATALSSGDRLTVRPPVGSGSSAMADAPPLHAHLSLSDGETVGSTADADGGEEGIVVQSWCRRTGPDGRQSMSGEVLISFMAGSRTAVAHIPWQPALPLVPTVWAEILEGDASRVDADVVRPYGMRLIARRTERVELPGSARVEFFVAQSDEISAAA